MRLEEQHIEFKERCFLSIYQQRTLNSICCFVTSFEKSWILLIKLSVGMILIMANLVKGIYVYIVNKFVDSI